MKKLIILIILISNVSYSYLSAYSKTDTNYEVYNYNSNIQFPIASLTKVMNILTALDYIKENNISMKEERVIDDKILEIKGSKLNLKKGDKLSLEQLLQAQIIYSANDAAYEIAYRLGGLENFVELMNQKARKLKMNNTVFYTPAGLPTTYTNMPLDISTAEDLYILAKESLKYENLMKWTIMPYFEYKGIKYANRNKIIDVNGNIGLKTGYHSMVGYNMIGINKIYDTKLITITLADENEKDRFSNQNKLSKEFKNMFQKLINSNDVYDVLKVKNADKDVVAVYEKEFFYFTKDLITKENIYELDGNIEIGDIIGNIEIYDTNNNFITRINIISKTKTKKLNIIQKILKNIM